MQGVMMARALLLCAFSLVLTEAFSLVSNPLGTPMAASRPLICSRSPRPMALRMQEDPQSENPKWASEVLDESKERIESVKAGALTAVAGSIAMAPLAIVESSAWYPSDAFSAQWELAHDGLALMLGLFGLVYPGQDIAGYAVRQDPNPQLKQGVVGAFFITRAASMLQTSSDCTPLPLSCGAPLQYLNWEMIFQGAGATVESAVAFGAAAIALEFAFSKGLVKRFPS